MSTAIYSYVHDTSNPITTSGSYQLFPTIYTGVASSGGGEAVFSGSDVTASISFAPALINAINPYIVQSENGANVTVDVDSSLIGLLTGSSFIANGGTINITGSGGISALSGSTYTIENGGTLNMGTIDGSTNTITALSGQTITFGDGGGTLLINPSSNVTLLTFNNINGFGKAGSTIEIPGASKVTNSTYNGTTTSITFNTGLTIKINGDYTSEDNSLYQQTRDGNLYISATPQNSLGNTASLVCFLPGSLISTPHGTKAVEEVSVGDEIIAYVDGVATPRRVTWTGQAHCNVRAHLPDDEAGYPVRILKDAISDGVPFKDMLITAEHCLFFDGKFVPARMLVNDRSIFFDKSVTSYDYYHVETEQHSVIMADGMLTESYLDTGNRRAFSQKGNVVSISSSRNLTWDDAAAPLGVSREFAEALFRQTETRAIAAGITQKDAAPELTEEANLHLITDTGVSIRPAREHNGRIIFMIPTGVQSIRIASNASRPSDVVGPFVDDRRYFGVAVGDITLFEGNRSRTITSHLTDRELDGWNTLEWEDCRWTSGNGLLPLGERHPNSVALIAIQIRKTGPYLATDTVQKKAALQA